jgi:hypothetical protein
MSKPQFLYGESTEVIYVNIPEGMNEDQDYCLQFKKTIYSLVQSARGFYKKLILVLKSICCMEISKLCVCCRIGMKKKKLLLAFTLISVLPLGKTVHTIVDF